MSKKTEELKVVSSEPLESIADSTTLETSDKKEEDMEEDDEEKTTPSVTTATDKSEKDTQLKVDEKPLPEIKKEDDSKKERKTVSFKKEVDETEEVPINEDDEDDSNPPPQPPRPKDPTQQVIDDLKEAFPTIEEKIITAVLIASQGNPDPAFNALLYISDPSFKPEIPVYVPVSQQQQQSQRRQPQLQTKSSNDLTDDELLARKLQKEFELEAKRNRRRNQHHQQQDHRRTRRSHEEEYDEDNSPDEFEQIKETFTQGLEEARTTLNGWVSNIAKRFDGGGQQQQQQQHQSQENPKLFGALGGSSFNDNKRKTNRFDEDPEIIGNDFHDRIRLQDNEEAPSLPNRPKNETDKKNWQPLEPEVNANSDAFLVTDSEDDDDIITTGATNNTTIGSNKK
ncbi:CUE5 Ubiquitin-binding protein CUE5 [Candida maltosa Xu316]|uniref:CUE domain-containing protein n=1 Tax=Candida maltosa (strain Xu316) TaxID=1245528 RepID=M3J6S9_CANMX|nr:hypothetical protein G210_1772 [Candida maltosa Xu316]